mmetsp:Transcript_14894/g.53593  ORF Transcript_14894/g.53593 Transcript_14894/m.53593 type:complete len:355 (+) Transcript_14894:354-1418(+)
MIPVGPRLIHPAAYSPRTISPPRSVSTRPCAFGTTPFSSSNGTSSSTRIPLYPTDRNTSETSRNTSGSATDASGTARRDPDAPSSAFARSVTLTLGVDGDIGGVPSGSPVSLSNRVGLRRNLITSSFVGRSDVASAAAVFAAAFATASRARRLGRDASMSFASSSPKPSTCPGGSTRTRTFGRLSSSRSSFGENAACATPLRPIITTRSTPLPLNAPNASPATSVDARSSASLSSIRAQSSATFPSPKTHAVCPNTILAPTGSLPVAPSVAAHLASPLYQPTNSLAPYTPGVVSSPGTPNRLSPSAPCARIIAWYSARRSLSATSEPSATLPWNATRASARIPSNRFVTDLVDA